MKINKKIVFTLIASALITITGCAHKTKSMYQSVKKQDAILLQSGDQKQYCPVCGMNLPMFYKTNHSATTDKGEVRQYCSMHCVVDDKEHNHTPLSNIKVVDSNSLKFIDAKSAIYVVGSSKKGTMSMISKYAFATKDDAIRFQKLNNGTIMSYQEAYAVAKGDFDKDNKMIANKKGKAKFMGKIIYMTKCNKIDKNFKSVNEAKSYIKTHKSCTDMNEKKLQAVSLYLSDK
jgi:hypothetical protein